MVSSSSQISENESRKKPEKPVPVDAALARHLLFLFNGDRRPERVKLWKGKHPKTNKPVGKKIAVRGQLGDRERDAFLTLCKLRQESDSPDVEFSLQAAAEVAQLEWHGQGGRNTKRQRKSAQHGGEGTAAALRSAMLNLRSALVILANIYFDQETNEFVNVEDAVTILDKLRLVTRSPLDPITGEPDPSRATLQSRFRFNPLVERALETGAIKPLMLDTYFSIEKRAKAAQRAYIFLDRGLFKNNRLVFPAAEFLEQLELSGTYTRPAERKRVLDTIAKHLDGLRISTGWLRVAVSKVKKGSDWTITAVKLKSDPSRSALPATAPTSAYEQEQARPGIPKENLDLWKHRSLIHREPLENCVECERVHAILVHKEHVEGCTQCSSRKAMRQLFTATIAQLQAKQSATHTAPLVEPQSPRETLTESQDQPRAEAARMEPASSSTPPSPLTHEGEPDPTPARPGPPVDPSSTTN